ncbi:hypothetical protein Dsin_002850 [Dipteronia sinensis]|uniref:Ubiquitin-like protease family profile domain-containing protein n=1 Tax=Dipteronia sinensis TaxID=43782 RepID=A0AAE0B7W6_9ROSI|nr:hypothetical protein Dsin_002850 [Dipteronia sinensis]
MQGTGTGVTGREQQTKVLDGTDTTVLEETPTQGLLEFPLLMEVQHVDPSMHTQDHTADPSGPLGQSPSSPSVHTLDPSRRSTHPTPRVHPSSSFSLVRSRRTPPLVTLPVHPIATQAAGRSSTTVALHAIYGDRVPHPSTPQWSTYLETPINFDSVQHWHQHWLVASVDLTVGKIHLLYPFRQKIPVQIRKEEVAPLRWFLPSMLHQVGFHDARPRDDPKYDKRNKPFGVSMVSTTHVPQQTTGGNCGAHTLRLIEYILADRQPFDWSEEDMGTIQEKMVVEVFCNSRPQ